MIPEERSAFFIVNHGEGHDALSRQARCSMPSIRDPSPCRSETDPARTPSLRQYGIPYRSSPSVPHLREVDPEQSPRSPSVPTACSSFGDRNGCRSSETCSCGRMASGCWASRVTTSARSPSSAAGRGASPIGYLQRRAKQQPCASRSAHSGGAAAQAKGRTGSCPSQPMLAR